MSKAFASSADLAEKQETLEIVSDGVYALTAEGDPNVGAVEGEDFLVCIDARATPSSARDWLAKLRQHTDKPVRYLVLTHYHAVRALGAGAFGADTVLASAPTRRLIHERGQADWDSEQGRMPRLFKGAEEIPGLTFPDLSFDNGLEIELGGSRGTLELRFCGRGHTAGDIVAWHGKTKSLFAGDLVEAEAALYTGDAFHMDWSAGTLDRIRAFGAEQLVGGRGAVARGPAAVEAAIEQTRGFLTGMITQVGPVHAAGGSLKEAFEATHRALAPTFGHWPIFEHCLPFNVQRLWDEMDGIDWPRVWTMERDREVWALLQG
ncbi:MBL fold metallo-hydrolase [Niveispirillum fermenti]|uniref:MBL fold metallo-hydrolase n=1 Tax=Niveispirillum fermenti TaxID=1233113 RepID=UPI003A871E74